MDYRHNLWLKVELSTPNDNLTIHFVSLESIHLICFGHLTVIIMLISTDACVTIFRFVLMEHLLFKSSFKQPFSLVRYEIIKG